MLKCGAQVTHQDGSVQLMTVRAPASWDHKKSLPFGKKEARDYLEKLYPGSTVEILSVKELNLRFKQARRLLDREANGDQEH